MKLSAILLLPLLGLSAIGAAHASTPPLKRPELSREAKITLANARTTALRARPGTITDQELEREAGGSGLRYSFDITSHGKPYEVGIDAKTGAVVENVAEGNNPD